MSLNKLKYIDPNRLMKEKLIDPTQIMMSLMIVVFLIFFLIA
jgi:hypothetical protein